MSEELNQRDLINNPEKIGKYDFRNIGSTSLLQLKKAGIIHGKDYKGFEKRKYINYKKNKKKVVKNIGTKILSIKLFLSFYHFRRIENFL